MFETCFSFGWGREVGGDMKIPLERHLQFPLTTWGHKYSWSNHCFRSSVLSISSANLGRAVYHAIVTLETIHANTNVYNQAHYLTVCVKPIQLIHI